MVIIFCLEFISVEYIDSLIYYVFILFNFFVDLVDDIRISFNLLLYELYHYHAVFIGFFIEKNDSMSIYSLIEDNIFNLPFCLANVSP